MDPFCVNLHPARPAHPRLKAVLPGRVGVWTKLVPDGRSMKVGYDPRPGERPDAGSARADFSASSATDDVQPDSTKNPPIEAPCACPPGGDARPTFADAPTAIILSKLELSVAARE